MAYLTATRYGLTHVEPTESQRASGWRHVWRHPSGALAMKHPTHNYWMVSLDGGVTMPSTLCSSLRAAALSIERQLHEADHA